MQAKAQLSIEMESGISFITRNDIGDGSTNGDIISLPDDFGINRRPNIRPAIKFKTGNDIYSFSYVNFSLNETGILDNSKLYEGYDFPANTPIGITYRFDGFRLAWTRQFLDKPDWKAGAGITLNFRRGGVVFSDGNTERSFSDNGVGIVPLVNSFVKYKMIDWLSVEINTELFYLGPDGNVIDGIIQVNFQPKEHISIYSGFRVFGGAGYQENGSI